MKNFEEYIPPDTKAEPNVQKASSLNTKQHMVSDIPLRGKGGLPWFTFELHIFLKHVGVYVLRLRGKRHLQESRYPCPSCLDALKSPSCQ